MLEFCYLNFHLSYQLRELRFTLFFGVGIHISCHSFAVYGWCVTTFPQVIVDFAHTSGAWLSGLFPDGISFNGYYQLYATSSCTTWIDINNDGNHELVSVNIGNSGTLWYLVHSQGVTLANSTIPFTKYDDIRFEEKDSSLYLVCEYSDVDFNSYRYKVTFDGKNLIFTPEE